MRQLLLIDFLLCFAFVADPAPAPTPTVPSIDQLLTQLAAQRKAKEDAAKAEAETVAAIKALLAAETAKAAAAGITLEPPAPVDPLTAAVQAAYAADPSVGKKSDAVALAGAYREIANQITTVATSEALVSVIESRRSNLISDRLAGIRKVLGTEFAKSMPATNTALTADMQTTAAKQLNRFADILTGVAK